MHTLDEIQKHMRHALLGDGLELPEEILGATTARFAVHRRHFFRSLGAALEKTFPAVVRLVDARFFAYAADAFVRAHPPKTPCLFEYGRRLPEFLDAFPQCASLPYLGDVAHMEWAMHCAFHAPDEGEGHLPPCVCLFSSRWPVDAIWRLALGRTNDPVDLHSGGVRLLFYRDADEVKFEALSECVFAFLSAFSDHGDLARAAATARAVDCSFDFPAGADLLKRATAGIGLQTGLERLSA